MSTARITSSFATLIRLIGDFDLAEEATHEAFAAAEQWSRDGLPTLDRGLFRWVASKVDTIRRRTRFDASLAELAQQFG